MERFGEWRQIEPASDEASEKKSAAAEPRPADSARDLRFLGVLAAGVMLAVGAYVWLTMPGSPAGVTVAGQAGFFDPQSPGAGPSAISALASPSEIVVDVEGAVAAPGLHRLPAGSRVGDAIAVAGGYSPRVDINAAAVALNLAERLADGAKIHVPVRGEPAEVPPSFAAEQPGAVTNDPVGQSVVNVNTATSEELDTLPGIGPVTAAKIIAARQAAPFGSIDELVSRDVVGAATLEKLRDLITVGP